MAMTKIPNTDLKQLEETLQKLTNLCIQHNQNSTLVEQDNLNMYEQLQQIIFKIHNISLYKEEGGNTDVKTNTNNQQFVDNLAKGKSCTHPTPEVFCKDKDKDPDRDTSKTRKRSRSETSTSCQIDGPRKLRKLLCSCPNQYHNYQELSDDEDDLNIMQFDYCDELSGDDEADDPHPMEDYGDDESIQSESILDEDSSTSLSDYDSITD